MPGRSPGGEPLESELARFFGYSHDVLVIMDGGGRVLVISPSVQRALGFPIEALIGRRLLRWVHPEDQPGVMTQIRRLLDGTPVTDLDARTFRADGGWVPMRWSLSVGLHRRIYAVGHDRGEEARRREAVLRREMAELRLRTAMELHDGILQTLTGASLQIAVARRLVRQDPDATEGVLKALADSIAAEQQEMRLYVDEVKGPAPAWADGALALRDRIDAILDRVGMIWGVATAVDARIPESVPAESARRVLRIVQEATVNAARHGGAKAVQVQLTRDGPDIHIVITDNGRGFSFLGDFDHEALQEKRLGPLSLKHRVAEAGGRISIRSTPQGSTVSVHVPVPRESTS